jgi:hypothetical protein
LAGDGVEKGLFGRDGLGGSRNLWERSWSWSWSWRRRRKRLRLGRAGMVVLAI